MNVGKRPSVASVIAAAGKGARMKSAPNKLLCEIGGVHVIRRTLEVFDACALIDGIFLVVSDVSLFEQYANECGKLKKIVIGGTSRQQSVYKGICAAARYDFVAVHDGARALVTEKIITDTVLKAFETGAAAPGVETVDTVKTVNEQGFITGTPLRGTLRNIQTPQVFKREIIEAAHKNASGGETDDCALVERIHSVAVTDGSRENIKITTEIDLVLANAILEERKRQ